MGMVAVVVGRMVVAAVARMEVVEVVEVVVALALGQPS